MSFYFYSNQNVFFVLFSVFARSSTHSESLTICFGRGLMSIPRFRPAVALEPALFDCGTACACFLFFFFLCKTTIHSTGPQVTHVANRMQLGPLKDTVPGEKKKKRNPSFFQSLNFFFFRFFLHLKNRIKAFCGCFLCRM
jgi:hypothetical protein